MVQFVNVVFLAISWSGLLASTAAAAATPSSVVGDVDNVGSLVTSTLENTVAGAITLISQDSGASLRQQEGTCPTCVGRRSPEPKQHHQKGRPKKWHHHGNKKWQHHNQKGQQKNWHAGETEKLSTSDVFGSEDDTDSSGSSGSSGSTQNSSPHGHGHAQFQQFSKGKLGLAWSMDQKHMQNFAKDGVSWWHNWQSKPYTTDNVPEDLTFCSTLWGEKNLQSYIKDVVSKPESGVNKGKCTMGMNEPNLSAQSGMSPQRACQLQRQYQIPLKQQHGYIVGSPAVANGPAGLKWMQQFKSSCPDVFNQLDFIAVHYYDTTLDGFKDWVNTLGKFDKPLLITELAAFSFSGRAQMNAGQVAGFMKQAVGWAVDNDQILGVGWTGFMDQLSSTNKLFSGNGSPNQLFNEYLQIGSQGT